MGETITGPLVRLLARITRSAVLLTARLLTAVRGEWRGAEPKAAQRIYFANHASHADFVLLWTVLPPALRAGVRPVAAGEYWLAGPIRRFLIRQVFRGVLIERRREGRRADPIDVMRDALDAGDSLILFPEGTRNTSEQPVLPFKPGLARLAEARPGVELIPVFIENLNRVLPKGELIPVPLLCTVTFGPPLHRAPDETTNAFLARARDALLALRKDEGGCEAVGS